MSLAGGCCFLLTEDSGRLCYEKRKKAREEHVATVASRTHPCDYMFSPGLYFRLPGRRGPPIGHHGAIHNLSAE